MEFNGEDDHVHLLVNYPPKVSVLALVNNLKGVSSRMIRQKNCPSVAKKLWGAALWPPSYFAESYGGVPIAVIRQYIEQQQTPHTTLTTIEDTSNVRALAPAQKGEVCCALINND